MQIVRSWLLRFVTALLLGGLFFRVVSVYQLFDFAGAPYFCFAFLFLGYLFLSPKYTPFLQTLFFAFTLFLYWQIWPGVLPKVAESPDFLQQRKLFLAVARVHLEGMAALQNNWDKTLQLCVEATESPTFSKTDAPNAFWVYESSGVWYMNNDFKLFSLEKSNERTVCHPHGKS